MEQSNSNPLIEELKKKGNIDGLIKALQHQDADVRKKAVSALADIGGVKAVGPLIEMLKDESEPVRRRAMVRLWSMGEEGEEVVEPLIKALNSTHQHVRELAAMALGKIGDPRAIEPLRKKIFDSNIWVQERASEAIKEINSQNK